MSLLAGALLLNATLAQDLSAPQWLTVEQPHNVSKVDYISRFGPFEHDGLVYLFEDVHHPMIGKDEGRFGYRFDPSGEQHALFAEGAVVILLGCKTAFHPIPGVDSMAEELSEVIPGSQVTGATGNSYPLRTESSSGREVDSNTYFTEGVWMTYENGGACPVEKKDTVNVTEIERVSSPVGGRALTSPTGL
jgi:hypothetical protein